MEIEEYIERVRAHFKEKQGICIGRYSLFSAGESPDGTFQVPTGDRDAPAGGLDIGSLLENMDLGAMGNMLKGIHRV